LGAGFGSDAAAACCVGLATTDLRSATGGFSLGALVAAARGGLAGCGGAALAVSAGDPGAGLCAGTDCAAASAGAAVSGGGAAAAAGSGALSSVLGAGTAAGGGGSGSTGTGASAT